MRNVSDSSRRSHIACGLVSGGATEACVSRETRAYCGESRDHGKPPLLASR